MKTIFWKNIEKQMYIYAILIVCLLIAIILTVKVIFVNNLNQNNISQSWSWSSSSMDIYEWRIQNQPFTKKPDIDFTKLNNKDE